MRYKTISAAALAILLQSDAPPPIPTSGASALVEMLSNSGATALTVLVILALASIYSWTLIFGKMGAFGRAAR